MCILCIHVVPLQIAATSDNSSLRTTVMEFCTEVTECGFTKAIPCITMDDKIMLIQTGLFIMSYYEVKHKWISSVKVYKH